MPEISEYARSAGDAFARLVQTVETLRDPGGCPWDAEQTHSSLRPHLLEEVYELLEAIDAGDDKAIEEELGDLMTHLAFHTDMGRHGGNFDARTTADRVVEKLVARHPHVFGDGDRIDDAEAVVDQWEALKRNESGRTSVVKSLPSAMPALAYAASVQRRAVKAGVNWPEDDGDKEKKLFGLAGGETEADTERRAGRMLLQVAREVRDAGIDPETALRAASLQFRDRVLRAEVFAGGTPLAELDAAARSAVWERAREALT